MPSQTTYYNRFGDRFRKEILSCPEPHLWTTDYAQQGRVYQEMNERIAVQEKLVDDHFTMEQPVLDIGCGFGRQAYLLAKKGFSVTGTDTSSSFIGIAGALFDRHGLNGRFICTELPEPKSGESYHQLLLLDVLEHIPPSMRSNFIRKISELAANGALLLVSLPHVKKRFRSRLNNRIRKSITQHLAYFRNREEHPYVIPERQDLARLTKKYFAIIDTITTAQTDYYLLKKR